MRQLEIHQGIRQATVPGAIKRKNTDPRTAENRLTLSELTATEPGPARRPPSRYISMKAGRLNTPTAR